VCISYARSQFRLVTLGLITLFLNNNTTIFVGVGRFGNEVWEWNRGLLGDRLYKMRYLIVTGVICDVKNDGVESC
jgi:hypothetical protein